MLKENPRFLEQGITFEKLTTGGVEIPGLIAVTLQPNFDDRGFFMKSYDRGVFESVGLHREWMEENHSFNIHKHTVRGIHFQLPPYTQSKFVRVITGEILFTPVDLRADSPTFGKWAQKIISAKEANMLFVPRGFGLSMCTLTDQCNLLYKVDNVYAPNQSGEIKWNDPELGIAWPIATPSFISEKDNNAPSFADFKAKYGALKAF